ILDHLTISNAQVDVDVPTLQLAQLNILEGVVLLGEIAEIIFTESISIEENSTIDTPVQYRFTGTAGSFSDFSLNKIHSIINDGQSLQLQKLGLVAHLKLNSGETKFMQAVTEIEILDLKQGVVLDLMDNNEINLSENILHLSTSGTPSLIKANSKGIFRHDLYKKYCLENIRVQNVDLAGEAVINLGKNAEVTNGS